MRVAIIIIGVIALVLLAIKWDNLPLDSQDVPREGSVLNSNHINQSPNSSEKRPICPKCKDGEEIVLASEKNYLKICKVHETVAINL